MEAIDQAPEEMTGEPLRWLRDRELALSRWGGVGREEWEAGERDAARKSGPLLLTERNYDLPPSVDVGTYFEMIAARARRAGHI